MGAFLAYTIYSGVFLLFLFLFYKVLVSGEKQISLNRVLLLSCYALAFAAWPLNHIDWNHGTLSQPAPIPTIGLEEISLTQGGIVENNSSVIPRILICIYLTGASLVLLKTMFSVVSLLCYIKKGHFIRKEDYTLVVMPSSNIAPFSFGRKIVMSAVDYETVCETVSAHELAHIQCHHYIDLIISQTVCVVLWYNPAAWLMRDELKLLHEYQADAKVIDRGVDISAYQMLLIRKTVGNKFHALANCLNHSNLKSRIAMMQKENCSGFLRSRVLALAIAPIVAFGLMNIPTVASDLKSLETVSLRVDDNPEEEYLESACLDLEEKVIRVVKTMPMQTMKESRPMTSKQESFIKLSKNGGAKLIIGPSSEKDCEAQEMQAFRVDGKILTESMTVDMRDIESYEILPPSKEFPGGLCDIKLKKK